MCPVPCQVTGDAVLDRADGRSPATGCVGCIAFMCIFLEGVFSEFQAEAGRG